MLHPAAALPADADRERHDGARLPPQEGSVAGVKRVIPSTAAAGKRSKNVMSMT
jgi:hypothetical protein